MDTHLHPNPSRAAPSEESASPIDLPERPPAPAAVPDGTAPRRLVGTRTWLLAGTAAVGILGLISTGIVYSLSRTSSPAHRGSDWVAMPQAVSPQRQPGQAPQPAPGATVGSRQRNVGPAPDAPQPTGAQLGAPATSAPKSGADDLRALKQPGPATLAMPRPPPVSAEASTSTLREASTTTQADAAANAQAPAATTVATPAANSAKPASTSADTRATPQDPLDVIGRVTQLADEIAEERREDADLRTQLAQLLVDTDTRFSAFEHRLSQAEAGLTSSRARAATERTLAAFAPPALPSPGRAPAPAPVPPGARRYEIRAASPGVAVLGTLDGTPTVIEIGIGIQVPGYGRVNAIVQKGSAWAVQCERGTIQ